MRYLILILLAIVSTSTFAHSKIGFVDTEYVIAYSNEGKRVNAKLNAKRDEYNKAMAIQSAKVSKMAEAYRKPGNAHLQQQYEDMVSGLIVDRDDLDNRMSQMFKKESEKLNIKLSIVIDQYRKHHGYDIIYIAHAGASYDSDLLITRKVLEHFNNTYP